jgi:DNA-binding NtrC family response regulator
VRELATVIERAALLGSGNRLECAAALGMAPPPGGPPAATGGAAGFATLDEAMAAHIRAALERTHGRIEGPRGAARLLAINPHTLRARMRKLGVISAQHRPRDE